VDQGQRLRTPPRLGGDLTTYTFSEHGNAPVGLLSLATVRHPRHGTVLQIHDFWAAHHDAVRTMLAFLGRYSTRAETIDFRRGAMPPYPALLHNLRRSRLTAQSWHPWMIRILDIPGALNLRGWPAHLDAAVTIALTPAQATGGPEQFTVVFAHGEARVEPATGPAEVTMTHRQLAAWYAGSYRSTASALLTGVRADSRPALATLITAAGDTEPWLPDHF
jgi:predicted acetyltransferase